MQLVYLKNIDTKKQVTNLENENSQISSDSLIGKKIDDQPVDNIPNQIKNQLKNINQIKTNPIKNSSKESENLKIEIKSFQDLINLANKEKEIELKYDLERNVKLVSFNRGKIDISFNEKLNKNFIKNLTEKLLSWTGERWIISLSKNNNAKSIYEKNLEDKNNLIEEFKKSKVAQDIRKAFPDAKLVNLTEEE
jgi:DNA polymerase-3 subunit gamma/tau